MKLISVSPQSKSVNSLLKKARRKPLILESKNGERFVLASVTGWEAFEIGEDGDITTNKKLMKHLRDRRSGGERISLAEVKRQLSLP